MQSWEAVNTSGDLYGKREKREGRIFTKEWRLQAPSRGRLSHYEEFYKRPLLGCCVITKHKNTLSLIASYLCTFHSAPLTKNTPDSCRDITSVLLVAKENDQHDTWILDWKWAEGWSFGNVAKCPRPGLMTDIYIKISQRWINFCRDKLGKWKG